ncbi:MAG: CoA transferase, partial [Acidimicrobiales bacterium]
GAMWLTGWPDGPPQWPVGDVIGALSGTAELFGRLASIGGDPGALDIGAILSGRAAARGGARRGSTSVGGRSRILRAADGWVAVTVSRPSDLELLPAFSSGWIRPFDLSDVGDSEVPDDLWDRIRAFARSRPAGALMSSGQVVGLPVAQLATPVGATLPWSISRLGEPLPAGPRRPRVLDFSAMWAGPLCAHLLGRSGAEVVKVEDAGRPDAARQGDPWLFEELHHGHEQMVLDFGSAADRRVLGELVAAADVIIEASRPRALGHLGLSPVRFLGSRPGRTWVSITGHGRSGGRSNWVAFGDDAAAAGGLVAQSDPGGPVFCADAIADPVSGLCAATGALASVVSGGGHLVACSMRAASSFVNRYGACDGEHRTNRQGHRWFVSHGDRSQRVELPRRVEPSGPSVSGGRGLGRATSMPRGDGRSGHAGR